MDAERAAHRYKYTVIGLVACSMLVHEILLTRICALRLYFHFAFLVISNCLLGLGASGALLVLFQDRFRADERGWLARLSAGYLVSLVFTYVFLLRYPLPADLVLSDWSTLATLSAFNLVGAVPFVFGGMVVGMLLTFNVDRVNRLYGVDLAGAGIGCILCPLFLPRVGAGGVFLVTALLALAATVVVAWERWRRPATIGGVVLGAVGLFLLPTLDRRFPVPSKGFVDYARAVEATFRIEPYSTWTANSRIDLLRMLEALRKPGDTGSPICMRGRNREGLPRDPDTAGIAQDATAGTTIVDFSDHPEALEILRRSMYAAAYRQKQNPKVLIIGLGGGNDAWAAKASGARSVKAIELNWPIVDIHKRVMRQYSRLLVEDPNVDLVVDEGRSALMREPPGYDVVQMTGIDTWTALASGAYVLAENYLYTREAIESMYRRLAPGGILQISRFAEDMEALRLLSNIYSVFEANGVPNFEQSIAALTTPDKLMAIQVKKGFFQLAEQRSTLRFAEENGIDVVYLPNRPVDNAVDRFIRAPDKKRIIADFPMNIEPTTDDRPYFFSYVKWQHPIDSIAHLGDVPSVSQGNPLFLLSQLGLSIVLSGLLILFPLSRRSDLPKRGAGRYLAYFSGLGLGFIFIEVAAIQKLTLFLGQPVYSLTVTLFSLLVFTGLGSMTLGARFEPKDGRIAVVPGGIALYLGLFLVGSHFLVSHFIASHIALRIALAVALLAPLGFLLGVPFAYGLKVLDRECPPLVPWAWAINGCLSVVGSVLTVIISMNFGFGAVLVTAALVYVAAFAALSGSRGAEPA